MELALDAPLAAVLGEADARQEGQVTWLDTGRVHVLLRQRLRVGSQWPLELSSPTGPVTVELRVLAVRVRTQIKEGPRVLHLCSLLLPPSGHEGLEALLRQVNPDVAPPGRPRPTEPSPSRAESKTRKSSRRRLPPQRRLSRTIPRAQQDTDSSPTVSGTGAPKEAKSRSRGLSTAELIRPEYSPGEPPVLVASIPYVDLFDRCCRWGSGWLQLTLCDVEEVPTRQDLDLKLVLPSGTQIHTRVRIARRSRGRMILESRELSRSAWRAIDELV